MKFQFANIVISWENQLFNSILLNTANVLYVFCYGVRDVLWLRILAVTAMILLLPFYANQTEPMIGCMIWQFVFIAINVYWVVVIIRERCPPKMSNAEQELYQNVFQDFCSAQDMLKLISQAQWHEADLGTKIIHRKEFVNRLLLIHSGSVSVQVKGVEVLTLNSGNLIGEVSFLVKEPSIADVFVITPVQYLSWPRDVLEEIFESKVELKSAIHEVIGYDLVQKLIHQNKEAGLYGTIAT